MVSWLDERRMVHAKAGRQETSRSAVLLDSELELECLRIPHFYYSFYVYKYATGLSAAVALASQVLASGDGGRCERVAQVVDAGVLQPGASADALRAAGWSVDAKSGRLTFNGQYTPVGNPSMIAFLDLAKR